MSAPHPADLVETRLLPCVPEAERGIVASVLISPEASIAILRERGLTPSMFHSAALKSLLGVLLWMDEKKKPIALDTLAIELGKREILETVGGFSLLGELAAFPSAQNLSYFVEQVEDCWMRREVIRTAAEATERAYDRSDETHLDAFEKASLTIRPKPRTQRSFNGADIARIGLEELSKMMEAPGKISGISTGFAVIDAKTDGLHETEVIVIAARPGEGKTALALQICEHLSIEQKIATAVFTLEMGNRLMALRILASRSPVNPARWKEGALPTEAEGDSIRRAHGEFMEAPFMLEELSDATIQQLRASARRLVSEFKVKLIVVDTLSKLRSDSQQGRSNREREVSEAIGGLKELAKELKIVVIVIVHLNRRVDEMAKKGVRPGLADLRESGAIEQDADTVLMLYRDDDGQSHLFGAKQRGGAHGWTIPLDFLQQFTRFREPAREPEQPALIDVPGRKPPRRTSRNGANQHPDD